MATISQIGIIENSLNTFLNCAEELKTPEYILEETSEVSSTANIISVGIGDGGISIKDKLDSLIEHRTKGGHIIFFHDEPMITDCYLYSEEETELKTVRTFNSKVNDLGLGEPKRIEYNFYNKFNINQEKHPVVTSYFDLKLLPTEINTTHNMGLTLLDKVDIVLNDGNTLASNNNYYLACLEEEGLGKVAFINFGHNDYGREKMPVVNKSEAQILVNTIEWLLN